MIKNPKEFIFSSDISFEERALTVFQFQYQYNPLYKRFVDTLNCDPASVKSLGHIPFLPISFFKSHEVKTTDFKKEVIFSSSGTTGAKTSQHIVKALHLYEESFLRAFEHFYGPISQICVLGLLPSYLERNGSSLVYMVDTLIKQSGHADSGFYLYEHEELARKLARLEQASQNTLLIGVTYALLDFAEAHPLSLKNTIVMETGGMKGRKKEMLREEVHQQLMQAFGVPSIHSEYGMTELLSQAYAYKDGRYQTPGWMKVLLREEDDPRHILPTVLKQQTGMINIIDLANIYSCSFIATDDVGKLHPDGSFEVLGRLDNSDIRGCSLLTI